MSESADWWLGTTEANNAIPAQMSLWALPPACLIGCVTSAAEISLHPCQLVCRPVDGPGQGLALARRFKR
jgi:hypothetical protein